MRRIGIISTLLLWPLKLTVSGPAYMQNIKLHTGSPAAGSLAGEVGHSGRTAVRTVQDILQTCFKCARKEYIKELKVEGRWMVRVRGSKRVQLRIFV
jgi:hypothetical protein